MNINERQFMEELQLSSPETIICKHCKEWQAKHGGPPNKIMVSHTLHGKIGDIFGYCAPIGWYYSSTDSSSFLIFLSDTQPLKVIL